jgi:hypothetical protein
LFRRRLLAEQFFFQCLSKIIVLFLSYSVFHILNIIKKGQVVHLSLKNFLFQLNPYQNTMSSKST